MPNRIIREAFITSEKVDSLNVEAERFFFRLLLIVDDYGRTEADATLLLARTMPRKIVTVTTRDIEHWLQECAVDGLVNLYEVGGKRYLEVPQFNQRIQSKASKFPAPPVEEETVDNGESPLVTVNHRESPWSTVDNGEEQLTRARAQSKTETKTKTETIYNSTPSQEEVLNYMRAQFFRPNSEEDLKLCSQQFFDANEAQGWIGRNGMPLVSWQAAARKWLRTWAENNRTKQTQKTNTSLNCNDSSDYR